MRTRVEDILWSFDPRSSLPPAPPRHDQPHHSQASSPASPPPHEPQAAPVNRQDLQKAPPLASTPMEEVVDQINDLLGRESGGPELLAEEHLRLGRFRFSIFAFEHQVDIHVAEGTPPQQIAADVTALAKAILVENGCRESDLRSLRLLSGEWLT